MKSLTKTLSLYDLTLFGITSILGSGGFNLIGNALTEGGYQSALSTFSKSASTRCCFLTSAQRNRGLSSSSKTMKPFYRLRAQFYVGAETF